MKTYSVSSEATGVDDMHGSVFSINDTTHASLCRAPMTQSCVAIEISPVSVILDEHIRPSFADNLDKSPGCQQTPTPSR